MRQAKRNFDKSPWAGLPQLAAFAILLMASFPILSFGQQKDQKTFSSPEAASGALFAASQTDDEKALLDIFGPLGKEIVSSGDAAQDAKSRANFVEKYQEMHRLVKEPDGTVTLYIGAKNWPTPIPIVNMGNLWYFDTAAGKQEILARRIGRNEMSAMRICQELVAAEKDYHSAQNNVYAQKIFSDEGQSNGLYWKTSDGQPQSPVGPLVAWAVAEQYARTRGESPVPFRGYYFHVLTRQGKDASGGAKDYVIKGKMTEGFAFVAYPAEYRSSGVMTFIVNQDGVVYEKDLGKKTEELAAKVNEYNPNSTWHKSDIAAEQAAARQKPN